jgi:hypothetical protein
MSEKQEGFDLDSIDAMADAGNAYELQMKDPAGNPYPNGGIVFLVIGRQSDEVNKFFAKLTNDYIREREYARRRGKDPEPKTAEYAREENISGAAIRVVGWRGVKQAFSTRIG